MPSFNSNFKFSGIDVWTLQKGEAISHQDIDFRIDQPHYMVAKVTGTRTYRVEIIRKMEQLFGYCACPAFDHWLICKHIAAVCLNPSPKFLTSSNDKLEYIFRGNWTSRGPVKNTSTIKRALDVLKREFSVECRGDSISEFYDGMIQEVVYQLMHGSNGELQFIIKCRQLSKDGSWGKLQNFNGNSYNVASEIMPYVTYDVASIPKKEIHSLLPNFIKNNFVIDDNKRKLQWLEVNYNWEIVTDSITRCFTLNHQFSDGVERSGVKIDPDKGIGFVDDCIFLCHVKANRTIYKALNELQSKKMSVKEWTSFQQIVLSSCPELLAGDTFNKKIQKIVPTYCFHFKYFSPDMIQGLIIKELPKSDDVIFIEEKRSVDFGYALNTPFVLKHKELVSLMNVLNEKGIEIKSFHKRIYPLKNFNFQIQGGIDWFETSFVGEIDNSEVELTDILKSLDEKGPFVTLKTGDQILLPEDLKAKLARLAKYSFFKDGKLLTHKTCSMLLNEWNVNDFTADLQFMEFKEKISRFQKITPLKPHPGFKASLRTYQCLGLGWLSFLEDLRMGGCLADDMGLGKTVQVLAHLHRRLDVRNDYPSLIVCPKTLIFNWELEAKKFTPSLKVKSFLGGKWDTSFLDCNILLISYALLRRNIDSLKEMSFDYVILDEAQAIKNPQGLTTKSVNLLKAQHRLALTGTPVENHLGDLMSIFNFLIPGCFKSVTQIDNLSFLKPFILRRKKEDVLKELPLKTTQIVFCEQTDTEKKYYEKLRRFAENAIMNERNKILVITMLTRLRQASCHLALLDRKMSKIKCGKLEVLNKMIQEIVNEGHKVLIFSQFTELLQLTRDYLDMDDQNSCYLDGVTKRREVVIQDFKTNPKKKCFFISLKAGGTGLNLIEANYCFILDPWWNSAVENQAIDRIYRIGQKSPVYAYRLITKGSIEEKVLELQKRKKELAQEFMAGNENFIKKLSHKDLQYMLEN